MFLETSFKQLNQIFHQTYSSELSHDQITQIYHMFILEETPNQLISQITQSKAIQAIQANNLKNTSTKDVN